MDTKLKSVFVGSLSGAMSAVLVVSVMMQFYGFQITGENNLSTSKTEISENLKPVYRTNGVLQEDMVVQAVEKSSPAVVSIIITKDVPKIEQYYVNPFGDQGLNSLNDPFGGMGFGFQVPQYRQNGTEKKEVGGGSGFLVSEDGYIMTNKHVVEDEKAEYTVFLEDDAKYSAKVVARDPLNDIAVLKIEAKDLPFLTFGDSENLHVGQSVIAIGNPLMEFSNSVSVGVVSGLSRSIVAGGMLTGQAEHLDGVIQTDAAINPGNSGGPLLNLRGDVVGMNVAIANGENIAFSIPANLVKSVYESVKENGKIVRPYLGLRYVQISQQLKEKNKLAVDYGVLVMRGDTVEDLAVLPGSPADKAGLVENDIVLEIDGKKLDEDVSLARIIAGKNVGDTVKLKVLHKGEEKSIEIKLEMLPE